MVGRKYIGNKPSVKPRLLIQQRFFDNLHTIEMYGATLFGEKVAEQFHKGIMTRITLCHHCQKPIQSLGLCRVLKKKNTE